MHESETDRVIPSKFPAAMNRLDSARRVVLKIGSALLTFVYGQPGVQAFVQPLWLRVGGADVRLQFAQLLGWLVMPLPLEVYPRWLVAAEADSLTELLPER